MSKSNLKDKAYSFIKEKIVNCEYMPNQFLIESDIMEMVGASRTPIREALNKLEQEGLVKILPKRGVIVSDITMASVNEIFEVRLLIEPYMIRTYGENIPSRIIQEQLDIAVNSGHHIYSAQGYTDDNALHELFINASGNEYMINMMKQIYTQNHRLRIISGMKRESRAQETKDEHQKILGALLKKDYDEAAKCMYEHLSNAKFAAVEAMMSMKMMSVNNQMK
ncbi:MAG: GntR family transcriptional regulator [Lachnospiraceae bacterium]|nr:GntR family transcriptional regulator [Lachnospiraceae bacterium]